jgi:peroxiredoxin
MLMPRKPVPSLTLPRLGGGDYDPVRDAGRLGSFLVFYRGLHCPICVTQLRELEKAAPDFAARGVAVAAISSDGEERTAEMARRAGTSAVIMAHSLPLAQARDWGLYISTGRGKTSSGYEEPAHFSEPGHFIVRADGTLYFGSVQTMPFTRPPLADLLRAIDYAIEKDYPARGEYAGPV